MSNLHPTLIITNGRLWTMDDRRPEAEALAVFKNDILAVGDAREIEALAGPQTEVIDVEGRIVTPGLADIHVHLAQDVADMHAVEIRDFYDPAVTSVEVILNKIKARAKELPPGKWIHALGSPMQDERLAEKRRPTRQELDQAAPENPCYANFGAHVMVANSLALKAVNIDRETPDPPGGWIMRDDNGELSGVLRERAQLPVKSTDDSKEKNIEDGIELALKKAASRGITVIHDIMRTTEQIQAYQNLCEQGRLPVRVQLLVRIIEAKLKAPSMLNMGFKQPFGNDMLKIGGSKMSIDGGFTARQAGFSGMKGLIRIEQGELDETVAACHLAGIRCCIHAIGDAAQDMALLALEGAQAKMHLPDIRHRIEHLGNHLFTPERRMRTKKAGAIPVTNPPIYYFVGDMGAAYVGPERNKGCFPLKTIQAEGFPIAFGSDAPGYWPVDSIRDIAAMVNRKTVLGTPMSPEEAISFRDGVRAQTKDAAWVGFEEHRAGTLAPGKIADICVFDRDPETCPPEELSALPVMLTVCAGRITCRK
jgi:predicted amidohydrolase YtcJ